MKYTDPDGNDISSVTTNPSFWTGLGILIGTIVEDIATLEAGIADDSVTLGIGLSLVSGALTLSNTQEKTESESFVTLYRAVSPAENKSIQATGSFLNPEGINI